MTTETHANLLAALQENALAWPGSYGAPELHSKHITDWSGELGVAPLALLRPNSTEQVSQILALCNQHRCPVIPQGGLTGLAGGATVRGAAIALSMDRMDGIIELDADSATMTVWAGTPLQVIQETAQAAGY